MGNELYKHSPDYILEKYNRYIGFEPNSDFIESEDDKLAISTYEKIWKPKDCKRQIKIGYLILSLFLSEFYYLIHKLL